MKILIADDDAISRCLVQKTLEREGYEVLVVEDGRSAARAAVAPCCSCRGFPRGERGLPAVVERLEVQRRKFVGGDRPAQLG
jgi:CheY-like chemotaxis protein